MKWIDQFVMHQILTMNYSDSKELLIDFSLIWMWCSLYGIVMERLQTGRMDGQNNILAFCSFQSWTASMKHLYFYIVYKQQKVMSRNMKPTTTCIFLYTQQGHYFQMIQSHCPGSWRVSSYIYIFIYVR